MKCDQNLLHAPPSQRSSFSRSHTAKHAEDRGAKKHVRSLDRSRPDVSRRFAELRHTCAVPAEIGPGLAKVGRKLGKV